MSVCIKAISDAVRRALGPAETAIPLHAPEFLGNESVYVQDCIASGWVSSAGSYVDRIEHDLCAYTGAKHAVATVNGTAALHLALVVAGVRAGDEVIVPTLSFIATANAVHYCHAVPHFVDAAEDTLGLDPERLAAHLDAIAERTSEGVRNRQTGRRIAAVVPMHAFGHPMAIEALIEDCARRGLTVIEDAAESLGSTVHGRHCGTFGRLAALSFNGNKVVTTGGGGAVLTDDAELAKRAKFLSTTAKEPHPWLYVHNEVGFNYRMPNINAALGCAQLERLPTVIEEKRRLAEIYRTAFAEVPGVRFVREPEGTRSNYWLNAIILDDQGGTEGRDAVLTALNAADYMARPAWTLLHTLKPNKDAPRMAEMPVAERLERTLINLPSSPVLGRSTVAA